MPRRHTSRRHLPNWNLQLEHCLCYCDYCGNYNSSGFSDNRFGKSQLLRDNTLFSLPKCFDLIRWMRQFLFRTKLPLLCMRASNAVSAIHMSVSRQYFVLPQPRGFDEHAGLYLLLGIGFCSRATGCKSDCKLGIFCIIVLELMLILPGHLLLHLQRLLQIRVLIQLQIREV
jgi:hypothetical protein